MVDRRSIMVFVVAAAALDWSAGTASADTNAAMVTTPDVGTLTTVNPLLAPERPAAAKPAPTGNPLWGVPLSTLTVTRERPIFSPSRRPPAAPVIAAPPAPPRAAPPPVVLPPARPELAFVGAIAGDSEGFAIFIDSASKVVRLRIGQSRDGWVLKSVTGREATLQRDQQTAVFSLPAPTGFAPVTAGLPLDNAALPVSEPVAAPAGSAPVPSDEMVRPGPGANFAPFVPRHTPKDGTPDGL